MPNDSLFDIARRNSAVSRTAAECRREATGAQGRNRTTDTAIFSRMLYQLSYLGIAGQTPEAAGHTGCGTPDQAESGGVAGGSSSRSEGGPGMRYCPVSHLPRSTSAQCGLQNGRVAGAAGLPQIGHLAVVRPWVMPPPTPSPSPATTGPRAGSKHGRCVVQGLPERLCPLRAFEPQPERRAAPARVPG
jgi:hypothetical protein